MNPMFYKTYSDGTTEPLTREEIGMYFKAMKEESLKRARTAKVLFRICEGIGLLSFFYLLAQYLSPAFSEFVAFYGISKMLLPVWVITLLYQVSFVIHELIYPAFLRFKFRNAEKIKI